MNLTAESLHNGKYVLNALLGHGIFGITYWATDAETGESVVLKTLSDSLHNHPNFERFRQKFLVGARRYARCEHPNLVRVLDCFEDAGRPYLVMEYIAGQTLAEVISTGEPLPVPQAIYYIRQIGAALSVLHQKKLLHRDVRPQNIIRCQATDVVVLTDFGIACDLTQGVRQTHASLLSAGYAAPEQYLMSANSSPATDVYALAATLYCLLLGRPPVPASIRSASDDAFGLRLLVPPLRQLHPNLSPDNIAALTRGLELDPEQRPHTVEAWLDILPSTVFPEKQSTTQKVTLPEIPAQPHPVSDASQTIEKNINNNYHKTATAVKEGKKKTFLPVRLAQERLGLGEGEGENNTNRLEKEKKSEKNKRRMPLGPMMMTSALFAAAGVGFGLALRLNHPKEPGSTVFHTEQSFPPRSLWPVSDSPEQLLSTPSPAPPTDTSLP